MHKIVACDLHMFSRSVNTLWGGGGRKRSGIDTQSEACHHQHCSIRFSVCLLAGFVYHDAIILTSAYAFTSHNVLDVLVHVSCSLHHMCGRTALHNTLTSHSRA